MKGLMKGTLFFAGLVLALSLPTASFAGGDHDRRDGNRHRSHGHHNWHRGHHYNHYSSPGFSFSFSNGHFRTSYSDRSRVLVSRPVVYTQPVVYAQPVYVPTAAPVVATYETGGLGGYLAVNVPNKRGGYTTVSLRRVTNGFIGPQGEYYSEFPSVDELKVIYG